MNKYAVRLLIALKRRMEQKKIENYYYSMGNNGKSYGARWLDHLFGNLLVFTIGTVSTVIIVGSILPGVFMGIIIAAMYYSVYSDIVTHKVYRGRKHLLKQEIIKSFNKKVEGFGQKDFFLFIKELFEKEGIITGMSVETDNIGCPVIMEGDMKEDRVGVYCRRVEKGEKISSEQLNRFVEFCVGRGLNKGVYITNGYFDYHSREYTRLLQDFTLHIADMESIYNIFLSKGMLFSTAEVERQINENILEHRKTVEHRGRKLIAYKRIKTYITLGVLIAFYSRYADMSDRLTFYYVVVSIVLLCLGVIAAIRWYIERQKSYSESRVKLEQHI